jgi:hypothetical protein
MFCWPCVIMNRHNETKVMLFSFNLLRINIRNIPSAVCLAPPEGEQVMLETCRDLWFSINWMKSASRSFHYADYPIQSTFASTCSIMWSIKWNIYGLSKHIIRYKISNATCTCKWLCVLDTSLFDLLKLQFTCVLSILQYHKDIKLFHLCRMCVDVPTVNIQIISSCVCNPAV